MSALFKRSIDQIIERTCAVFGVRKKALCGASRIAALSYPRMIAMKAMRLCDYSFPEIGAAFGGRDHTTAISGVRKVDMLLRQNHVETVKYLELVMLEDSMDELLNDPERKEDAKKAFGMDWSDTRPLQSLTFALDDPPEVREANAARVRDILERAGVRVADDIAALGCTGLARTAVLEECDFVRAHIAGAGVGLTCFVPPTRFCLVHDTIGGLQPKQVARSVDMIEKVSRPLTVEEERKVAVMEEIRRTKGATMQDRIREAHTRLTEGDDGVPMPEAATRPEVSQLAPAPQMPAVSNRLCSEHEKTNWRCRACLAHEILNGPYEPRLLSIATDSGHEAEPDDVANIAPDEVETKAAELDQQGATAFGVYVQVARWSRRLARE